VEVDAETLAVTPLVKKLLDLLDGRNYSYQSGVGGVAKSWRFWDSDAGNPFHTWVPY